MDILVRKKGSGDAGWETRSDVTNIGVSADSSSRMGATWLSIWSHGCFSILSPLLG